MFFGCSTIQHFLKIEQPKAFCDTLGDQIDKSMWILDLLDQGLYNGHSWIMFDKAKKCAF